jgi:hypothetical protein
MESYSVLLKSESNVPAPALAAELAKILERPIGELTRALRENPWILIESVDAGDLDAVFEALGREGVIAKAVPEIHMPHLPPALRVRDADPMKKGLFLKMAEPPSPPLLPWEEVRLVAVGEVTLAPGEEDRIYGAWRGGAPSSTLSRAADTTIGSAGLKTTSQKSKSPLLMAIVAEGEEILTLGIDAGNFNYEYLKERMKPTSRENFRLLVGDILKRHPTAEVPPRTRSWLDGGRSMDHRFRSLKAFAAYIRWVLQQLDEREAEEAEVD